MHTYICRHNKQITLTKSIGLLTAKTYSVYIHLLALPTYTPDLLAYTTMKLSFDAKYRQQLQHYLKASDATVQVFTRET